MSNSKRVKINMSSADNSYALSRQEHDLHFTEKSKQTNDLGLSVKLTYNDISSLRFLKFCIYESKEGENISNVFMFSVKCKLCSGLEKV